MPIRKVEVERLTAQLAEIGVEAPPHTSARDLRIILAAEREKRVLPPLPVHPRNDAEAEAAEVADRLAGEGIVRGETRLHAAAEFHAAPTLMGRTAQTAHTPPPPPSAPPRRPGLSTAELIVRHLDFTKYRPSRWEHRPPDGPGSCRSDIVVLGAPPDRRSGGWM